MSFYTFQTSSRILLGGTASIFSLGLIANKGYTVNMASACDDNIDKDMIKTIHNEGDDILEK